MKIYFATRMHHVTLLSLSPSTSAASGRSLALFRERWKYFEGLFRGPHYLYVSGYITRQCGNQHRHLRASCRIHEIGWRQQCDRNILSKHCFSNPLEWYAIFCPLFIPQSITNTFIPITVDSPLQLDASAQTSISKHLWHLSPGSPWTSQSYTHLTYPSVSSRMSRPFFHLVRSRCCHFILPHHLPPRPPTISCPTFPDPSYSILCHSR